MKTIINIEGGDGSGKTVLSKALYAKMIETNLGTPVVYLDLPDYESITGKALRQFLYDGFNGKGPLDCDPITGMLPYVINRREYYMRDDIHTKVSHEDCIIISNRSYLSNLFFHASRILSDECCGLAAFPTPEAIHDFDEYLIMLEKVEFAYTWLEELQSSYWRNVSEYMLELGTVTPGRANELAVHNRASDDGSIAVYNFFVNRSPEVREQFIQKRSEETHEELDKNEKNTNFQIYLSEFAHGVQFFPLYQEVMAKHPAFMYYILKADYDDPIAAALQTYEEPVKIPKRPYSVNRLVRQIIDIVNKDRSDIEERLRITIRKGGEE